jgi:hypothetical protein
MPHVWTFENYVINNTVVLTIHATAEEGVELFTSRIANGMTVPELAEWIDRHVSSLFVSEADPTEA